VLGYSCNHHGCSGFTGDLPREESFSSAMAFIVSIYGDIKYYKFHIKLNSRYMLEVITFVSVVMVSVVYTETFFLMPLLIKTILTLFTWCHVKNIHGNSFGKFYTEDSTDPTDDIY
jgi:hypothetical protein